MQTNYLFRLLMLVAMVIPGARAGAADAASAGAEIV
jgi:hypothetical protein